jgi:CRISPR/Cas system-associated exonuclease Cas4 (RecB family)
MERGTRIHEAIEQYIRGEIEELPAEAEGAQPYADIFRDDYQADPATLLQEQMWYFDEHWSPLESYDGSYWLAKLDVIKLIEDGLEAQIVDWKSGKKMGNEVKHADQIKTYVISAFAKYENLTHVECLLRYTDAKEETHIAMTRQQAIPFIPRLDARIKKFLNDTLCYPNPSVNHCRYCPYKQGRLGRKKNAAVGTGHCDLNPE